MLLAFLELRCLDSCRFQCCRTLCWNMTLVLDLAGEQMTNSSFQERKIGMGKHTATFSWSFSSEKYMAQISSTVSFLYVVNFHMTLFQEFILFLNPGTWWFVFYAMQQVVNSWATYCVKQYLLFIVKEAQSYQCIYHCRK